MAVIELSKPGLEATTYELIITSSNAASTVAGIIGTQLLSPLKSSGCTTAGKYTYDILTLPFYSILFVNALLHNVFCVFDLMY